MKIESVRLLNGLNIHSHYPVVVIRLNLEEYAEVTTNDIGIGFINRLLKALPGLNEHTCSKGYAGGFVERLHEGTLLGHVIEHTALELQKIVGIGTYFGKTRRVDSSGVYNVVFEYKAAAAAQRIAYIAVKVIKDLLKNIDPGIKSIVEELKKVIDDTELGPSTQAIVKAARKKNIPITRLGSNSLIQLGYGSSSEIIQATITGRTPCIAVDLACDKALTKQRLRDSGLPVPYGRVCNTLNEAIEFARQIQQPIVIKPVDGNQGKGVSLNLTEDGVIERAFYLAKKYCDEVLVEEYIDGNHYRCAIVNGRLIAASWRIPAHVIGDGRHSIAELMDIENLNPLRGEFHEKPLTKLKYDPIVKQVLQRQSLSLTSVPAVGDRVFLRENANLSTGGIAYDVTDIIHKDNRQLVENAVKIIGLDVAGVDIVLDEITKSYRDYGGAIIEINAAPGLRMHHYPAKGKSRDVAAAIVDYLFPGTADGRIPIVTVTGTNGKTTTVRLLAHMLKQKYDTVGYTSSDGIYINGECLLTGDTTGPLSTRNLLERKEVDVAVLELARGGILHGGIAYDYSDVAIVTNIGYDHVGQDGILSRWELADLKSLTLEALKSDGHAVINADDSFQYLMTDSANENIIYFSLKESNPVVVEHLSQGNKAVYLKNNNLIIGAGGQEQILLGVKEIPITFDGKARYNVANALAAVAAGVALGLQSSIIADSLRDFNPNIIHNPGRQNIISMPGDKTIMIDYAHNPQGLESLTSFVKELNYKRIIGVVCAPGDRTDEQLIQMGKIIANGFDKVIIKEDQDTRGRKAGDIAKLLQDGFYLENPQGQVEIILDEIAAITHALRMLKTDELLVVTYENLNQCLRSIRLATGVALTANKKLIAGL